MTKTPINKSTLNVNGNTAVAHKMHVLLHLMAVMPVPSLQSMFFKQKGLVGWRPVKTGSYN